MREEPLPRSLTVETYGWTADRRGLWRDVALRNGGTVRSEVRLRRLAPRAQADAHAAFDRAWLQSRTAPPAPVTRGTLRVADLFSGCGALSLGLGEAARAVGLAVEHVFAADSNPAALQVYARNFRPHHTHHGPLEALVDALDAPLSFEERRLQRQFGRLDVLAGGPPCQGNSDLNNHTRRKDPKNALFLTMVRFAQVLAPTHVIIENVPGVRHDRRGVTATARDALERMGYRVVEDVLVADSLGVAQSRRRYVLVATRGAYGGVHGLTVPRPRTLRWACDDVTCDDATPFDSHATTSAQNRRRIDYLFDHALYDLPDAQRPPCHRDRPHSYSAVYGRLHWDQPAPTITSGFNSPGQGRFVHPEERRTLTPHEAARVQFLPDFFDWGDAGRERLMQMIGNAVPPKLAYAVGLELFR